MRIKQIASNMTELHLNNGTIVLFSYETPVAVFTEQAEHLVTNKKYSSTTTKHINKWLGSFNCQVDAILVDQATIDELVGYMNDNIKLERLN